MHVFLYQIARTTGGTNAGISRQNTTERRGKGTLALAFALESRADNMEAEVVAVRFSNIEPNSKRGRQRLNELKKLS